MKSTLLTLGAVTAALFCSASAFAAGEGWTSDFAAAKKEAASSEKDLLIDFTGSDWCGWCIRLNKEVFSHDEFKVGTNDTFVKVELDYPQDKSILTEEVQKQNAELKEKYPISGYPTILLADAEGRPYAATGYQQGGPDAYVTHLNELRGNKATRDEAFAKAEALEGPEKAEALIAALQAMNLSEEMVQSFYGDITEKIQAADPEDTTGFIRTAKSKEKFAEIQQGLNEYGQKQDTDGAEIYINEAIKNGGLEPTEMQMLHATKAMVLAQKEDFDGAIAALDEAAAVAPDSDFAPRIGMIKQQISAAAEKASEQPE